MYKTLVPHRYQRTRSLARYVDLNHFFLFQKMYASINFASTSSRLQQKKHTAISQTHHHQSDTMLFYALTHTILINKCSLVSPGPKHSSVTNIPQREISVVSLCA